MDFTKIAPYLQDPLVLIGFILLLFFGFGRAVLKSGVIPTLTRSGGLQILSRFLLFGFILALAITALGFGLKYRELSKAEQQGVVRLLKQELSGNLNIVEELRNNIVTISNSTNTVASVLRHPKIKIMAALFPVANLDASKDVPASLDYATELLRNASANGLLTDDLELQKFNEAAQAVAGTIRRTRDTIASLFDEGGIRYPIKTDVWDAHLEILRKIQIVSVEQLQKLYQDMAVLRANYAVAVRYSIGYQTSMEEFFGGKTRTINRQRLAAVLAAERIFVTTTNEFKKSAEEKIAVINDSLVVLNF